MGHMTTVNDGLEERHVAIADCYYTQTPETEQLKWVCRLWKVTFDPQRGQEMDGVIGWS